MKNLTLLHKILSGTSLVALAFLSSSPAQAGDSEVQKEIKWTNVIDDYIDSVVRR